MYLAQFISLLQRVRKHNEKVDYDEKSHDLEDALLDYYERMGLDVDDLDEIDNTNTSQELFLFIKKQNKNPFAKLPPKLYNNIIGNYSTVLAKLKIRPEHLQRRFFKKRFLKVR